MESSGGLREVFGSEQLAAIKNVAGSRYLPQIDVEAVRLLVSISELRSFKGAAERHRMTVSNVSNRIRKLERDFGAQVLRRTTRTLELTALGRRLVMMGEMIAHELTIAEVELARIGSQLGGSLAVSVADELVPWVTPLILQIAQDNPRLRVVMTSESRVGAQPDIRVGRVRRSVKASVPISMGLFQSLGAPLAPRQVCVRDLSTLPVCTLGHAASPFQIELHNDKSKVQLEVMPCFVTTDVEVLLRAVEAGVGVGLIPDLAFGASASRSRFKPLLPDYGIEMLGDAYEIERSDHARTNVAASYVCGMLEERLRAPSRGHSHWR